MEDNKRERKIIIDNKIIDVKEGEEYFIPKKTLHRIITEKESLELLEISFGLFDENDIIRIEDNYNRIIKS